jgi:hypothetical protein
MSPGVSGGFFPIHRNLFNKKGNKKMANEASFKVVVKNGDQEYLYDKKSATYKYKTTDYVYEASGLGDALREFLDYVNDEFNEDKVSLTVIPAKKKGK